MKQIILASLALLALIAPSYAQQAKAVTGQAAPDFQGMDTNGKVQTLAQYKGKIVVLEWTNPDCPYVRKHYDSGNMQALQKEALAQDVIWLSVASSAPDKEGYQDAAAAAKWMAEKKSAPTARILDPTGAIGHLYGAKTTPHMFVIDPKGLLVYSGAIDDNDSFKPETIAGAKNYVREAIKSIKAGTPVETASTKSYGCSVKYDN